MPIQMKLNQLDDRLYNPDRDLAYCSIHLIHRAVTGLNPLNQEPYVVDYLTKNNVSNDDLVRAAAVLAAYCNGTMRDPQYKDPLSALKSAAFFDLKPEVQIIVLAKLGQVFLSAYFSAARDVTKDAKDPIIKTEIISAEAAKFLERYTRYAAMPKWRRKLCEYYHKIRQYLGI